MREPRTRITLFLPAPVTLPQHFLVDEVLTALIEVCGGVTASQQFPAVFSGWWLKTPPLPVTWKHSSGGVSKILTKTLSG